MAFFNLVPVLVHVFGLTGTGKHPRHHGVYSFLIDVWFLSARSHAPPRRDEEGSEASQGFV
jgi:hypothetical protein